MSLTLERTAHETSTTPAAVALDATATDVSAAATDGPADTPLGGSYVSRAGSAAREGTYVTTSSATARPRRGTYVTTAAAARPVGGYTDTHGAARA
jgi:hypothetical protein